MTAMLLVIAIPAVVFPLLVYVTGKLERRQPLDLRPAQDARHVLRGSRVVDAGRRQRIEVIR